MLKNYIIIVKQRDVIPPRVYKLYAETEPTIQELLAMGVNHHTPRNDVLTIDEVSDEVFNVISGRFLRKEDLKNDRVPTM